MNKEHHAKEEEILRKPIERVSVPYKEGLNDIQVQERIEKGWINHVVESPEKTNKQIVKDNIFTYFNLIFFVLSILLIIAGSYRSLTFLPIIIANTLIGIIQEIRAKNVLSKMNMLHTPYANVVRNGQRIKIPTEELVIDDIVVFSAGNQICADAEVIYGEVRVNEALLTGESDEIVKSVGNRLMSGSVVASGVCYARLNFVGEDSYISKLTMEAKRIDHKEQSEMIAAEDRLDDYSEAKAKSDASSSEKAAYDKVVADGKKAINAAKDQNAVTTALKAAKVAVNVAIVKIEDDRVAANKVTDTIDKLPANDKVATTDKAAIEAARKAYDALTADQKKNISANTLKKLEGAEKALAVAEAKQVAQEAMNSEVKVTVKGKKIVVQWTKAASADGYDIYVQYAGKKIKKPVKTIKKNSTTKTTIKKINGKKFNSKKQFRVYVVAYKMIDGKKVKLAKSTTGHVVGTKNKKYTNVKSIKLTKKAYTVKVGKTTKVKAKVKLVDKNKKHILKSYGAKFRYRTSDSSIATVSKSGKIKGIKKGTCTIYVYAINGKMKKAKVTVE